MADPNMAVDNQITLEISKDGGTTFIEVPHASNITPPSTEKVQDDITPSNATNKVMATVNFTEQEGMEFELPYDPSIEVHKTLYSANLDGTTLQAQISWTDPRMDKFKVDCQVPKFEFGQADPTKKVRANVKLSFAGAIEIISA